MAQSTMPVRRYFMIAAVWLLKPLLFIVSLFYWFSVSFRAVAYQKGWFKSQKFPVKTISVGNISAGGTGKTPMTEYLIRRCRMQGYEPAYLSRGYGRDGKEYIEVDPFQHTAREVGDEALQIASKFPDVPVAVCADRVAAADRLLKNRHIDFLILDDAFQHGAIGRDLDIVMIDANRLPWKDWLLPFGRLRESSSALKRADLVMINKVDGESQRKKIKGGLFKRHLVKSQRDPNICFTKYFPQRLVPFTPSYELLSLDNLGKRACMVFSGIANHAHFVREIENIGLLIIENHSFEDHHYFGYREMKHLTRQFKKATAKEVFVDPPIIVTTEKDYNRLKGTQWFQKEAAAYPFYYLEISLEIINGVAKFDSVFDSLIAEKSTT